MSEPPELKSRGPKPPAILYALLKFVIRRDMKLFVLGDFDEEYLEIAETRGRGAADKWYWRHFLRSLPSIILDSAAWRTMMFRNYLMIAFRNMQRQKVFSLINILGLSLALMVCLWIFLFIKDEFSFDRFHKNRDSIYSVFKTDHHFENQRRLFEPNIGPALKNQFPGMKYSVRLTQRDVVARYKDRMFAEQCQYVDQDFFRMFSFDMIQGEAATALEKESAVVLTEGLAGKYFGRENPIGKILTITIGQVQKDFVVSGIAADVPSNSFVQFKMLMNINELVKIYGPPEWGSRNWTLAFTFIQLEKGISPQVIEAGLPAFFKQHFGPLIAERKSRGSWNEDGPTITLRLQSLKDIHFHSQGIEGPGENQASKSYILGGIGLLILFIACVNFTNLSIGRASTRTVEIGMRKILGAKRKSLIQQFWSESTLIVFIAMGLGLTAAILLLPLFNRLASKNILESEVLILPNLALFAAFTALLGVLAGIYPGMVLSRIPPACIFRRSLRFGGKTFLTRLLVMVQFSVSVFLVIATLVLSKQLNYILTKDLGYDREGVVVINTFERRDYKINHQIFTVFRTEAEGLPHIKEISGCVFPLSSEIGSGKLTFNDKRLDFNFTSVHYNFFNTMGIKIIAGGDFPLQYPPDSQPIIVTESFVKAYEIENPVGTLIDEGTKIIGVVEDIHFWNLKEDIKPTIILLDRRVGPRSLLVRIDTSDMGRAIGSLENIWKKAQPNKPFDYSFEDDIFLSKYAEERRWNGIVFFSSFFAILISCMGLFGITALAISRRVKEIGIRRILGAPVFNICRFLASEYLILVAASNLIAWPLGYYVMSKWLNGYAYRTHLDAGIFLLTGALTVIISMGTIGFWVFKAASADPVQSLRYE